MAGKKHMRSILILVLILCVTISYQCKDEEDPATATSMPVKVANPQPPHGAVGQPAASGLGWSAAEGADSYDVYFGIDQAAVSGADDASPQFAGNQAVLSYNPGGLNYMSTYYWRIDSVNAAGTCKGNVWWFTTGAQPLSPPAQAANPWPVDGAIDLWRYDLLWDMAADADSYNVYFGTDQAGVSAADTSTAEIFKGSQTSLLYDNGMLDYDVTYYWRIDSVNDAGVTKGVIWSFTTEDRPHESIEAPRFIYVIDRGDSMRQPANKSLVDENGDPVPDPAKIDFARVLTIKSVSSLEDYMKFAIVAFSTEEPYEFFEEPGAWSTDASLPGGHWNNFPTGPAPLGSSMRGTTNIVVWPPAEQMVEATRQLSPGAGSASFRPQMTRTASRSAVWAGALTTAYTGRLACPATCPARGLS